MSWLFIVFALAFVMSLFDDHFSTLWLLNVPSTYNILFLTLASKMFAIEI